MNKTNFRMKITSIDYSPIEEEDREENASPELTEYITEAEFIDGDSCEIVYRESEELGMGDTVVKVCWMKKAPQTVSVVRGGEVETVMTFEEGKRHISSYSMPGMSFELCTRALRVDNRFDIGKGGDIYLDYIIEIRGAFGGRRKMILEPLADIEK